MAQRGFVGARVLEASTIFADVVCLLAIVTLRRTGVGADALVIGKALVKSTAKLVAGVGKKGSGISSMTITSGGHSVTIGAKEAENIRKAAEGLGA